MSCNCNNNDGMGAGLTFLSTIIGMMIMAFAFLGSCSLFLDHVSDRGAERQAIELHMDKEEFY